MSRLEHVRRGVDGPIKQNQRRTRLVAEAQGRGGIGLTLNKGDKAEQKRDEDRQFVRDWIHEQSEWNLDPKKRFNLALRRGNDNDVRFVLGNIDDMGEIKKNGWRVDIFTFTIPAKPSSVVDAKIA